MERVTGRKELKTASAPSVNMVYCLSEPSVLQLSPALDLLGEHRCTVLLLLIPWGI